MAGSNPDLITGATCGRRTDVVAFFAGEAVKLVVMVALFVVLSAIEISGLYNVRFWVQFFAPFLFLAMRST